MKCEKCNIEHDGSYGSGRFCSCKCARGFSTKDKLIKLNGYSHFIIKDLGSYDTDFVNLKFEEFLDGFNIKYFV